MRSCIFSSCKLLNIEHTVFVWFLLKSRPLSFFVERPDNYRALNLLLLRYIQVGGFNSSAVNRIKLDNYHNKMDLLLARASEFVL